MVRYVNDPVDVPEPDGGREVDFLATLYDDLHARFREPEMADQLFAVAASEFLAGPDGVHAMWQRFKTSEAKN